MEPACACPSRDSGDTLYWEQSNVLGSPRCRDWCGAAQPRPHAPSHGPGSAATREIHRDKRPLWLSAFRGRLGGESPSKAARCRRCAGCGAVRHRRDGNDAMGTRRQCYSHAAVMRRHRNGTATATQQRCDGNVMATQWQRRGNVPAAVPCGVVGQLPPSLLKAVQGRTAAPCLFGTSLGSPGNALHPLRRPGRAGSACHPLLPPSLPGVTGYSHAGRAPAATRCLSPCNRFSVLIVSKFSPHTGRYKY